MLRLLHGFIIVTFPVHSTSFFRILSHFLLAQFPIGIVPVGSASRGGDAVVVVVKDINQPSLPTPFYSVLVSLSVFIALSTVFYSLNSPDDSLFSHSVLPALSLPHWSFQLYIPL